MKTTTWATTALGPILWAQGQYVRKTVPILPEPEGPREGTRGNGPPLRLLITGDSSAAGVGVRHQDDALLGRLVSDLARDFRVEYQLLATTGSTTRGTLQRLEKQTAKPFDVAVTSLGVNDATRLLPAETFTDQQSRLMALLQEKFGVKHVVISGLPPMHLFPALPQPLRWAIGRHAIELDRSLAQALNQCAACHFLRSDYTLDANLMATDGFHPGAEIYGLWAAALANRIRSLLLS